MKKIISFVLVLFIVFTLFANPLEKVTTGKWETTAGEEYGYEWELTKEDVILYYCCDCNDFGYVTLTEKDVQNDWCLYYSGTYVEVRKVLFELTHNRLPEIEWTEMKRDSDGKVKPVAKKLVKRTIAKADAVDSATGKREGVHTAASRASEAKEDFEWSEE